MKNEKLRIGLYSAGLRTYWNQFAGLRDRLLGYNEFIAGKLAAFGDVYNFGLVDNVDVSENAAKYFLENRVDVVFLHSATYFTSDSVVPIHKMVTAPVVVLNLQPSPRIDYDRTDTGEWLANCGNCPVPEVSNAFQRAGIKFRCISGLLGLEKSPECAMSCEVTCDRPEAVRAWKEIGEWTSAAAVKKALMLARFGFLGNNYSGMLDLYSDCTLITGKTGVHVEIIEMCDLDERLRRVTPEETEATLREIEEMFEISGDSPSDPRVKKPAGEQLLWSAKVAAAQKRMVEDYDLDALAYYYHSVDGNPYEELQSGFIVGLSMLTARGIPCAGEADLKTAVAMKICDLLGTGGSFAEIVLTDYLSGTILIGHDGPFHVKISDKKPILRGMGVYHGKKGSGISVEAKVKRGPVTTLGITQTGNGRLRFIISEGEATADPIMQIGNTQTHVKFGCAPDEYMEKWFSFGPTHHCALSVGHNASVFRKLGELMNVETVVI